MEITRYKKCSKCGETKTWENYHKNKRSITGHVCRCKECIKKENAQKPKNPKKPRKAIPEEKECFECKILKPINLFNTYTCSVKEVKYTYARHYCKDCERLYRLNRYKEFVSPRRPRKDPRYTNERVAIRELKKKGFFKCTVCNKILSTALNKKDLICTPCYKKKTKEASDKVAAALPDFYVINSLKKNRFAPFISFSKELIVAQRCLILIKRQLKELKNESLR
jgi:hypothetical protein